MKPKTITDHGVPKQIPGRGPNGRRFCRWCHAEVPQGLRAWCNEECYKHGTFNWSRCIALRRDEYKCTQCGVVGGRYQWPRPEKWIELEVDHIVAVKDGGSHHPDNLRTLCRECHKARTREQRRRRAFETIETNQETDRRMGETFAAARETVRPIIETEAANEIVGNDILDLILRKGDALPQRT